MLQTTRELPVRARCMAALFGAILPPRKPKNKSDRYAIVQRQCAKPTPFAIGQVVTHRSIHFARNSSTSTRVFANTREWLASIPKEVRPPRPAVYHLVGRETRRPPTSPMSRSRTGCRENETGSRGPSAGSAFFKGEARSYVSPRFAHCMKRVLCRSGCHSDGREAWRRNLDPKNPSSAASRMTFSLRAKRSIAAGSLAASYVR